MKKIISIAVVASVVFSFAAFGVMAQENAEVTAINNGVKANAGDKMEKILSPDLIKFFKNIEKRGISLYGIRKDKMVEKKDQIAENKTEKKLEKIAHPDLIKFFENIKKIGNALWGSKKEVKSKHVVTAEESACVISAIETKDADLVTNNNSFTEKLNTAITTRTACQKTALGSTENQTDNLNACAESFQKSIEATKKETNKNHENIWNTYKDSLKVCGQTSSVSEDSSATEETSTSTESVSTDTTSGEQEDIEIEDGGGSITELTSNAE